MIRLNKKMTWEDIVNRYHGKRILAEVYSTKKIDNYCIPDDITIICVAETDHDEDEIDQMEWYNRKYDVIFVPNTPTYVGPSTYNDDIFFI